MIFELFSVLLRLDAIRFSFLFSFSFHLDEQLLAICLDFFQAGTETTSNTLSFALMYMIHNRHVYEKTQAELDAVIGRKRFPNLQDRNHLPYVEAVLSEIQRVSNVAPLGIAHRCTDDVKFFEYIIPKDTVMLVSLYSLNMDREYWQDPEIFRPERFLNDNGEYIAHSEQFFPFGLGKWIPILPKWKGIALNIYSIPFNRSNLLTRPS